MTKDEAIEQSRRVLIVEDEGSVRLFLRKLLEGEGFVVHDAETVAHARAILNSQEIDLLLTDKNLPDGSGLSLAPDATKHQVEVILMSAYANLTSAVQAMQVGVADYVVKPIEDIDDLLARIERALQTVHLKRRNSQLVAELQKKNETLEAIATRDPLTGLFNHAYFQESLERELHRAARGHSALTLAFVDLDRFKEVNDTLGHPAGDRLLKTFADIFSGSSRRYDMPFRLRSQDIAARYGGDEFAIILPETPRRGGAVKGERLRQAVLALPFNELGLPPMTVSIGVACFPEDGEERGALIEAADAALYAAKRTGRNRLVSYTKEIGAAQSNMGRTAELELTRIEALEKTISEDAFRFEYQPIIDTRTNRIIGYEALCRPEHDLFDDPQALIQTAERAGRVIDLGRRLRVAAAGVLERLEPDQKLFINLHPHELNDALLGEEDALKPHARRIVLEVCEELEPHGAERAARTIDRLRKLGFGVAITQFDAGYASLQLLVTLQPTIVKISHFDTQQLETGTRTARLLKHLLEFAAEEQIQVIVHGIETGEQRACAKDSGFYLQQGYTHGRAAER